MFTCLVFLKLQYIAERKIKIEINTKLCYVPGLDFYTSNFPQIDL